MGGLSEGRGCFGDGLLGEELDGMALRGVGYVGGEGGGWRRRWEHEG